MKPEIPSSWLHPIDCRCDPCRRAEPAPITAIGAGEWAWWGLAGLVTGNAIAFVYDPHGALSALAACIGVAL